MNVFEDAVKRESYETHYHTKKILVKQGVSHEDIFSVKHIASQKNILCDKHAKRQNLKQIKKKIYKFLASRNTRKVK